MGLETNTEVGEIQAVQDRDGESRPPSNADQQEVTNAELQEANQKQDTTNSELQEANQKQDTTNSELSDANEALGNAESLFSDEVVPSTSGGALPSHSVEDGKEVLVMADPSNGGIVYVGPDGGATVPLTKGNGVTLQVSDTGIIAAKASEQGQTLHIIGEGA